MSDGSDKIFAWYPATGEVKPLRRSGWWVQYPKPSCSRIVYEPFSHLNPVFKVGDFVRLKGKPDLVRKVIIVEWHRHRYEFVYIVETSASDYLIPYWFAPQLILEREAYQT